MKCGKRKWQPSLTFVPSCGVTFYHATDPLFFLVWGHFFVVRNDGRKEWKTSKIITFSPTFSDHFFLSLSLSLPNKKNRKDKFVKMEIEQLAFFCFWSNYLRYYLSCLLSKNKCKCIHTQLCPPGKKTFSYLHLKYKFMSYCIKAIVWERMNNIITSIYFQVWWSTKLYSPRRLKRVPRRLPRHLQVLGGPLRLQKLTTAATATTTRRFKAWSSTPSLAFWRNSWCGRS